MRLRRAVLIPLALGLAGGLLWAAGHGRADTAAQAAALMTKECKMEALERSACVIEMILADLRATYTWAGGGGISGIAQTSTTSFTVSLPREEHVDKITYDFDFTGDQVRMVKKTEE